MMKLALMPTRLRTQSARAKRQGTLGKVFSNVSPLPLLVILMITTTVMCGLACQKDSDCRRNVCIFDQCKPLAAAGGICQRDSHCVDKTSTCSDGKCVVLRLDPSLMEWEGNRAPSKNYVTNPSVVVGGLLYSFEGDFVKLLKLEAFDPSTNTWTTKTGPEDARYAHTVAAVGTTIYLVGGYSSQTGSYTTKTYSYDTVKDTWDTTSLPDIPKGRNYGSLVAVDNVLFLLGGTDDFGPFNDIFMLDLSASTLAWTLATTLPYKCYYIGVAVVDKDIYITGGLNEEESYLNKVYKYNTLPENRSTPPSSTNLQTMKQGRQGHVSFYDPVSKRLYVAGGIYSDYDQYVEYLDLSSSSTGPWVSANAFNNFEISGGNSGGLIDSKFYYVSYRVLFALDVSVPASVKFSPFANMPLITYSVVQMTSANTFTVVDTENGPVAFYNTATGALSVSTGEEYPNYYTRYTASAVVNRELYVMGGDDDSSGAFQAVVALSADGKTWSTKDNMPARRTAGCAAVSGSKILFYGGSSSSGGSPVNNLYVMDTTKAVGSGQWSELVPVSGSPTAVAFCSAVVAKGKLLIIGGSTNWNAKSPVDKIQIYDIATNTWESPHASTITARSRLSAVLLRDFVFIIGGFDGTNNVANAEVLDTTASFSSSSAVTAIDDLPTPRSFLGSVTDGSSIFSVGGLVSSLSFPSFEKLSLPRL